MQDNKIALKYKRICNKYRVVEWRVNFDRRENLCASFSSFANVNAHYIQLISEVPCKVPHRHILLTSACAIIINNVFVSVV